MLSLCDCFCSCAATYCAGVGSYTVSEAGCLCCNRTCFCVLNVYTVAAITGIGMICIILIGVLDCVSDCSELSCYGNINCYVGECIIPACKFVMVY